MSATKTRLTKTGQPVMGTVIEVHTENAGWERAKVVGKGIGLDGHTLVMVIVEWESDELREPLHRFPDLVWRPIQGSPIDGSTGGAV